MAKGTPYQREQRGHCGLDGTESARQQRDRRRGGTRAHREQREVEPDVEADGGEQGPERGCVREERGDRQHREADAPARRSDDVHRGRVQPAAGGAPVLDRRPGPPEAQCARDHREALRHARAGRGGGREDEHDDHDPRGQEGPPGVGGEVPGGDDHEQVDRVHEVEDPRAEPLLEEDRERAPPRCQPTGAELAVLVRDALGGCGRRQQAEPVRDQRDAERAGGGQGRVRAGEPPEAPCRQQIGHGLARDRDTDPPRVGVAERARGLAHPARGRHRGPERERGDDGPEREAQDLAPPRPAAGRSVAAGQ